MLLHCYEIVNRDDHHSMGFFPRNEKYFEHLNEFVATIRVGAELFVKLFDDFERKLQYAEQIKEVEVACDRHSATIIELLNTSFITPLDREDIYLLATELDDIMDMINEMARLTVLYRIDASTPAAVELARLLQEAVAELEKAFAGLKSRRNVRENIDRIRAVEERGDRVSQEAIQELFSNGSDSLEVIKWLKMYEELEDGLDRCKKVAKVLAGIVVKNA